MELPHFLIVAGVVFLVGGFVGFALDKKDAEQTTDADASHDSTTSPPSATAA